MENSLIDFIKTGSFSTLHLNSSLDEVKNVLGEPCHELDDEEHSAILSYDCVEFIFGLNGVASIEVKLYERGCENMNFSDLDEFRGIKLDCFLEKINSLNMRYNIGNKIGDEFVLFIEENQRASFEMDILKTISIINPEWIY